MFFVILKFECTSIIKCPVFIILVHFCKSQIKGKDRTYSV